MGLSFVQRLSSFTTNECGKIFFAEKKIEEGSPRAVFR